jgi:amino acid transporter
VDAVISPAGTGLIYLTSASRVIYGLSRNGYVPEAFERTAPKTRIPVLSVIVSSILGLIFLLPFPSWGSLVGIITSASVLMYSAAPLALGALRLQKPDLVRSYRLPGAGFLAPLAYVCANLIVYWAGWQTYSTLMIVMLLGYLLLWITRTFKLNSNIPALNWQGAKWFIPYLIGMGVISYLGSFGHGGILGWNLKFSDALVGGNGHLPLYADMVLVAAFSLAVYYSAISHRLSDAEAHDYIGDDTKL